MAAACADCGRPVELPRLSPEVLYFEVSVTSGSERPNRAVVMPDESYAVAWRGVIYRMTPEDWRQYQEMMDDDARDAGAV